MTPTQRASIIDAADQSENVYALRQLVRLAAESSESWMASAKRMGAIAQSVIDAMRDEAKNFGEGK